MVQHIERMAATGEVIVDAAHDQGTPETRGSGEQLLARVPVRTDDAAIK